MREMFAKVFYEWWEASRRRVSGMYDGHPVRSGFPACRYRDGEAGKPRDWLDDATPPESPASEALNSTHGRH